MEYNPHCLSSFLTLRYVYDDSYEWKDGIKSNLPQIKEKKYIEIHSVDEIDSNLQKLSNITKDTGILLSSGIDSAILASYVPNGTKAYTIDFVSKNSHKESILAEKYVDYLKLDHHIVNVEWKDYEQYLNFLMIKKNSPLHPVEVALHKASIMAKSHGLSRLIIGNGADSTFGGMDKLLSSNWALDKFAERYTFLDPNKILNSPISMKYVFEKYSQDGTVNVPLFLKQVHGTGIIQAFENAIESTGVKIYAPYEDFILMEKLDMMRIATEPKYMLYELFHKRFRNIEAPRKIPFVRPMNDWLEKWEGPTRKEFILNYNIDDFSGEQRWLLYCLEKFLNLYELK